MYRGYSPHCSRCWFESRARQPLLNVIPPLSALFPVCLHCTIIKGIEKLKIELSALKMCKLFSLHSLPTHTLLLTHVHFPVSLQSSKELKSSHCLKWSSLQDANWTNGTLWILWDHVSVMSIILRLWDTLWERRQPQTGAHLWTMHTFSIWSAGWLLHLFIYSFWRRSWRKFCDLTTLRRDKNPCLCCLEQFPPSLCSQSVRVYACGLQWGIFLLIYFADTQPEWLHCSP